MPRKVGPCLPRSLVFQSKIRSTWQLCGHCMALICVINFGRCRVVGKGSAVIIRIQRRSSGLNGLTQEPSLKQDKSAHLGSPVGPEPPLNKAVCQCCLTWKDLAKQFPFPANTFFRQVVFHAFGKAKLDAPAQLARLARQGWETLPIALAALPRCVVPRSVEADWRVLFHGRAKCTYRE